ncbi:hypothetical protein EMWEY_00042560 [Eimeria maxima]|uniref:Uncharacterized protein n=1 Tax=Eimeria maxima TaxID=5804 RepID=U6MIX4_EIMMA|nr:hypothetical protein EMWEY_00042560 [Eimeria maxima]CDJ61580.1 hypothetical protein EMWEY_00042560 [Eimeria maxima]
MRILRRIDSRYGFVRGLHSGAGVVLGDAVAVLFPLVLESPLFSVVSAAKIPLNKLHCLLRLSTTRFSEALDSRSFGFKYILEGERLSCGAGVVLGDAVAVLFPLVLESPLFSVVSAAKIPLNKLHCLLRLSTTRFSEALDSRSFGFKYILEGERLSWSAVSCSRQ